MNLKKVIGGLLAALGVLWVIGTISSHSRRSDVPQTVQVSPGDGWQVTEKQSPMDDSKKVVVSLDAENTVDGPLGPVKPTLIVRCQEKKTDLYIVTGMAATVEDDGNGGPSDTHKVGIRLDDDPPSYYAWGESTDHKSSFASDLIWGKEWDSTLEINVSRVAAYSGGVAELAKKIATANTLTFQFTPFDGSPQVARFDVRGLDPHLHKVAEACGWAYE